MGSERDSLITCPLIGASLHRAMELCTKGRAGANCKAFLAECLCQGKVWQKLGAGIQEQLGKMEQWGQKLMWVGPFHSNRGSP